MICCALHGKAHSGTLQGQAELIEIETFLRIEIPDSESPSVRYEEALVYQPVERFANRSSRNREAFGNIQLGETLSRLELECDRHLPKVFIHSIGFTHLGSRGDRRSYQCFLAARHFFKSHLRLDYMGFKVTVK